MAVCRALETIRPQFFTLENVPGYAKFKGFKYIKANLEGLDYRFVHGVLNAADYGAPQTRKRLWLLAIKGPGLLCMPTPTHHAPHKAPGLFTKEWVGWGESIAHLPQPQHRRMNRRMTSGLPDDFQGVALASGFKDLSMRSLCLRSPLMPASTLLASMDRPSLLPWVIDRTSGVWATRPLGVKHLAALQTFPSKCKWGRSAPIARQVIGNSVAPLQMTRITEHLITSCVNVNLQNEAIA